MATDPVEILNRRNAEVAKIRGYVDLTEEAKNRKIAEVNERARAEYVEASEAAEKERTERLEKAKAAVYRVPIPYAATEAEEAQIHAAFRAAYNDVYLTTTVFEGDPAQAEEEIQRLLQQAERTGDKLLARAAYHRAIDLGVQSVVDAYLSARPQEERAWNSYTEAYQEASQSRSIEGLVVRGLMEHAFSSEAAG
jgi:hypothetical protein